MTSGTGREWRWQDNAACKDTGSAMWFPELYVHPDAAKAAKVVCRTCIVREECLEFGLSEYHGIWGGFSEKERRDIRRRIGWRPVQETGRSSAS